MMKSNGLYLVPAGEGKVKFCRKCIWEKMLGLRRHWAKFMRHQHECSDDGLTISQIQADAKHTREAVKNSKILGDITDSEIDDMLLELVKTIPD